MSKIELFKATILKNSVNKECFYSAIKEWIFTSLTKEEGTHCICGQSILYNYHILNILNNRPLIVGSICINKVDKEHAELSLPTPAVVSAIKTVDKIINSMKKKIVIFGKHEGLTFEEVLAKDKAYSKWVCKVESPKAKKLTAKQRNMSQYKQYVRAYKIQ